MESRRVRSTTKGGEACSDAEDTLLAAAATLAGSGVSPDAVQAFSTSQIPCSLRCTISAVTGEEAHLLGDLLMSFGAQSTSFSEERHPDRPEQKIYADGKWNSSQLWDHCSVTATFDVNHNITGTLETVKAVLGKDELEATVEEVLDEEWQQAIKDSYIPFQVQEGMWVVPSWCEIPDKDAVNILMEPGLAFGTGEHPTTRLCLSALKRHIRGGETVMDYGTGSGVLAVGALKLGASRAAGTDVDPLSVRAATANSSLNAVESNFDVFLCGADLSEPEPLEQAGYDLAQFDVVVANILRGPLVELKPRLLGYLKPGGRLLMSGVTAEQAAKVAEEYSPALVDGSVEMEQLGSWMLVSGVKR